jgi:toxin YoeB
LRNQKTSSLPTRTSFSEAIAFHQQAFDDYSEWSSTDKKLFERIHRIIVETARTPFEGLGKPEPLKHHLKGYWPRRLTDEYRLVYKVTDEHLIIASCKYHYD